MERLVGLALSRYLAVYIKDFNSSQFKNWSLRNLEFKEDVVQSLAGIPANFELKKVTCNEIYVKIPSLSKLGSDPIVLVADTIYIELEEPEIIKVAPLSTAVVPPPQPKHSQGLMDRIMDNLKFELKELRIKLKLRGKEKRSPTFDLIVQDIEIKSTNAQWQVVDLRQVHTVDKNGHVIMYKEIDIGRFTFSVSENDKTIPVLNQLPIRVRTKTKKAYFRGPTINHAIFLDILDELKLRLHSKQFKVLQDAVDSLLECMGRAIPVAESLPASTTSSDTTTLTVTQTAPVAQDQAKSYSGSLWGRFASVIGSYAGYGSAPSDEANPAPGDLTAAPSTPQTTKSTPPEGNADFDAQPSRDGLQLSSTNDNDADSDSDEEYRDAESEVPSEALVDKTSAPVQSASDDITHTSYTIGLKSGSLSVYDFVLEEQGIAELKFTNLRCQFIPKIQAVRPKICFDEEALLASEGSPMTAAALRVLETELVEQTQISVAIESYGLNQIDPGTDRHPDFTYLLKRLTREGSGITSLTSSLVSEELPTLTLDFVKFPDWKTPSNIRKEAQLTIDSVAILADLGPWERLWNFFFGGQKGEKFAQYMQENLGQMLEAALNDQVHFKFVSHSPTIILPPFASKFVGKPHLASKVLRIHMHNLTIKSLPIESLIDSEFSRGLFVMEEFPATKGIDFTNVDVLDGASGPVEASSSDVEVKKYKYPKLYDGRDPLVMTERKFECSMNGMWIDIQADPTTKAERVLRPFDFNAQMIRREFQVRSSELEPIHLPRFTPQLDGFVSLSNIGISFTPSQYTFMLGIWTERLAWNPNRVTEEMNEARKMELLLEAAEQGASSSNVVALDLTPPDDPPLLMRVRVFMPTVNLQLLERPAYIRDKEEVKIPVTTPTPPLDGSSLEIHLPDSDSPSSTIQHDADADDATATTHVILAEMAFNELSYVFESHAERTIQKVSSPHFVVTSPAHADSPFSKLVSPLSVPLTASADLGAKPALLVRMEKFKDEAAAAKALDELESEQLFDSSTLDAPVDESDLYLRPTSAASPVMNVRLHGMQVCWIYTTLAEVQVWFTRGDEIPPEFRNISIPYIIDASEKSNPMQSEPKDLSKQEPPSLGMNWAVIMAQTELVVVETPDTPECMPMGLLNARVERRGVSLDETQFDFFGRCIVSSEMWQADNDTFARTQLTDPFTMEVAYIQERNPVTNNGSTNMEMLIDDLRLTINRKQLIMIQNILDNQMADIRDVSTKREAEKVSEAVSGPPIPSSSGPVPSASLASSTSSLKAPLPEMMKITLPRSSTPERKMMQSSSGTKLRSSTSNLPSTTSHDLEFNPRVSVIVESDDEFNPRSSASTPFGNSKRELSASSSQVRADRPGSLSLNSEMYKDTPPTSSGSSQSAPVAFVSDTLIKALRSRFQIGIQKMNLKLLDGSARPIASIRLDDFLYSTENWSDVSVMLIEGGLLTIASNVDSETNADFVSPYATILQPRLADSIGGQDAVVMTHAPTLVPVVESFMPVISEETGPGLPAALQAKLARELKQAQKTRKNETADTLSQSVHQSSETVGIPIEGSPNYGSISASPMVNSFVMLSPSGSAPAEVFDPRAEPSSAPSSSKQPRSFKAPRRKNRRSSNSYNADELDEMAPLTSSSSASNLRDLSSGANMDRMSQSYAAPSFAPVIQVEPSTSAMAAPVPIHRHDFGFMTPQKLNTSAGSKRSSTPFPASGRVANSLAFAQSLSEKPAVRSKSILKSSTNNSSDDTSLKTPSKLSSTTHTNPRPSASTTKKKRNALWTEVSVDSEPEEDYLETDDPVQLTDGRMFSLKFETMQRDFKGVREEKHAKWMSRWSIGFAPFDIVYDTKVFTQLQDFFALMAEHKNLRHRYQSFQTEVLKVYKEQGGILNPSTLEEIQSQANQGPSAPASSSADESANRVALNILISGPRVSIPQPLEEESKAQQKTLLSVLEFSLDSVRVINQANARAKNDYRSQTKIMVTGARCFMKTIELSDNEDLPSDLSVSVPDPFSMDIGNELSSSAASILSTSEPKTLGALALQTQELARPINAKIVIEMKPVSASGRPFMHVSVDIDMLAAMISIKRYQLLVALINDYILSFFKRTRPADDDVGVSPEYSALLGAMSGPKAEQEEVHVDKLIEMNVKTVNLTVISDYMAELELVYLHMTDFSASMGLYNHLTDLTLAGRLEVLINNLNYMIPERFVDELNFIVRLRSERSTKKAPAPPPRLLRNVSMQESSINDLMYSGHHRRTKSLQINAAYSDTESVPDLSVYVEPDDDLISLDGHFPEDDISVAGSEVGASKEGDGETTTTLDIAVLDGVKFTLTQDLTRHLVELYQLYSQVQEDKTGQGNQSLLHFQYVLVNRTDLPIRYWQTNTDDARVLKPGDEMYFTFSNPYQLKRLEIEMAGWTHNEQAFSPDEVGSMVFHLSKSVGNVENNRDLLVSIQPKGLKRYVEFLTTHHVVNDTDKVLLVRLIHAASKHSDGDSATEYMVAPHTTVPISCSESWPVDCSVSFADGAWEFSRAIPISKERPPSVTDTIKLFSQNSTDERWLLCTTTREPYSVAVHEGVQMVTLHLAAPVVIENLCVFPLEYYFPSMLPRKPRPAPSQHRNVYQAVHEEEDKLADSIASVLPANSTTYFYFDTFRHRELCCRLVGYSMWSGRIQIERIQYSSLELYKTAEECMEGEKDDILLSVFIYGRHHDFARRLAFNTQFLFVNDTDMLLFVRQQNTIPLTQIAPRQMTPFSWVRGSSKMLSVNMGNTAWSQPIDISADSFQRIEIKVPNFNVSYMFLMESHGLDTYSRVVAWRSWFHIRNHSSYDLKFYLKGARQSDSDELPSFELDDDEIVKPNSRKLQNGNRDYAMLDEDEEASVGTGAEPGRIRSTMDTISVRNTVFGDVHVSDQGWIVIPRHSNTTSGLCPDILGLTIAKENANPPDKEGPVIISPEDDKTELWSAVEVPLTKPCNYAIPISSLADPRVFRALDVSVTTDERGLYITLTDNKDPPFIIHNETPYAVRLKRQPKSQSNPSTSASELSHRFDSARITNTLATSTTEEYIVEPNSKLNLFSAGLGDEDDFEYRASVITPEEYRHHHAKHARKISGGNAAGLGLTPATIVAPGHRRVPSGSGAYSTYHGDALSPPPPTLSVAPRNKRHALLSGSGLSPIVSPPTALPSIIDADEDDLMSAMDGVSDEDEEAVDFVPDEPSSSMDQPSSIQARPRRRKHVATSSRSPNQSPGVVQTHKRVPSNSSPSTPPVNSESPTLAKKSNGVPPLPELKKVASTHARKLSSSGAILSPRATLAMDAMDALSSAIGIGEDGHASQVFVTNTMKEPPSRYDGLLARQFRQYFSQTMDTWSEPFTLKSALEFNVEWQDERDRLAWGSFDLDTHRSTTPFNGNREDVMSDSEGIPSLGNFSMPDPTSAVPNMLIVTSQPQGKTRVVKFGLPPVRNEDGTMSSDDDSGIIKKDISIRRVMKVDFLVPEILVLMLNSETRDPAASIRLTQVQLEVNQFSNLQHSVFFVVQEAESNTLSPKAEYPVLFGTDRRALHGAHPHFLEFLVEWNVREERTFIEYIGLRVLPFVLQIDSEIIDSIPDIQELLSPLSGAKPEDEDEDAYLSNSSSDPTQPQPSQRKTRHQLEASSSNAQIALPGTLSAQASTTSFPKSPFASLSSMDLISPEAIAEYSAVGRIGLGDSGAFGGGYFYSGAADRELTDNNPAAPRNRVKRRKLLKQHTEIQHYQFVVQDNIESDNFLYVGRLEVFPLRVSISVGTNNKHWPVIAEAHMQLPTFSRIDLSESIGMLFSTLGSAYSNLVWAEIYQIIGNLDAIASPLQNLKKLAKGVQDFLKLPLEGLVLDDTPGAYLVGLWYGTASLLLNWTDFLLTVLMKSFQTLSWVTQVVCLDEDYQRVKGRVARQHPTNVIYGVGQGVRECARGIFEGVSGFVTLPMRGVNQRGAPGFFSGAGKALLGFPLKPIGGVFDLFSKTFEGLLQTLGRGYLLQERADTVFGREQLPEAEVREQIQRFVTMRDQRILILDDARFMRHGRPLERYLVLTFHALYIINVNKLHFDDYSPKKIPLGLIKNLVVPVTPETQMVVKLHQGQHLWKQDQFLFIVPDRKHFILKMAARFGIKTLEVAKLEKLI